MIFRRIVEARLGAGVTNRPSVSWAGFMLGAGVRGALLLSAFLFCLTTLTTRETTKACAAFGDANMTETILTCPSSRSRPVAGRIAFSNGRVGGSEGSR